MTQIPPSSMQDEIARRRGQTFVGRGAELDTFREQLTLAAHDPRRYFVLNVFGQGGVGKTTLLHEFIRLASGHGAAVALTTYTEEVIERDTPKVMAELTAGLGGLPGDPFHAFRDRYRAYRQKRAELEADPDAPAGLAGLFGRAVVKVGAKALRNTVPGSDAVLGFVEEPLAEQAGQWAEFVYRKLGNRDEAQLVLEPEVVLTPLFVQGVNALAAARPVALLFDTYERTAHFLDGWLHDLIEGRHGKLPENLTLVIAGRHELDRNAWADLAGVTAPLCLNPFTEAEARDYLGRQGVVNEQVVEVILSLSGRLPLLLMILARQRPGDPARIGDATGTAVERFLKWVDDPARRALALNGALPRQLNRDVAALLGGGPDAFDWLTDNRLIEQRSKDAPWTYHEVVREQMLRYKRQESPGEWAELHERLAAHYAAERDGLGLSLTEGARNEHWRVAALEELYHRLCARPERELAKAVNEFVAILNGHQVLARMWAMTLEVAGHQADLLELEDWGRSLRKGLEAMDVRQYEDVVRMATKLLQWPKLNLHMRPIVLVYRGDACREIGQCNEAIDDLTEAIELVPDYAWAIASRGKTHGFMKRYDKALDDLGRAIKLAPNYVWALVHRGRVYRALKRYRDALADFDCVIRLNPNDAWSIAQRGEIYQLLKSYDKALDDLDRAIELAPNYIWALATRGETYRLMERYEDALVDLDRVLDLNPDDVWALATRGETYRLMERYEDALANLDRVFALDSDNAWARIVRGRIYLDIGAGDAALSDFDRANELDSDLVWAIAIYGQACPAPRRHEGTRTDSDSDVELDSLNHMSINPQNLLHPKTEWSDEAFSTYNGALDTIPTEFQVSPLIRAELRPLTQVVWTDDAQEARSDYDSAIGLNFVFYQLAVSGTPQAKLLLAFARSLPVPLPRQRTGGADAGAAGGSE